MIPSLEVRSPNLEFEEGGQGPCSLVGYVMVM